MQQNAPGEMRNLLIAVVASTVIIFGWQFFLAAPPPNEGAKVSYTRGGLEKTPSEERSSDRSAVDVSASLSAPPKAASVAFSNDSIHGELSLRGSRLEELSLRRYTNSLDKDSGEVRLLRRGRSDYAMESGFVGDATSNAKLPGENAVWTLAEPGATLTPDHPLELRWESADVSVTRKISLNDGYVFTYTDVVRNKSDASLRVSSYGASDRMFPGKEGSKGHSLVHNGAVAGEDGVIHLEDYDDIFERRFIRTQGVKGWIGLTDHYWLTAALPPQNERSDLEIRSYRDAAGRLRVKAGFIGEERRIAPGASSEFVSVLYAGPKELSALEDVQKTTGAERFDRTIDFGWVYFLSKPLFVLVTYLRALTGNFGLAIIGLTCIVRALLYPLANKSYTGMQRMKALQPKMEEIRKKHAGDSVRVNQEMMALYQREKVNPLTSGCFPMLLQFPVFYALYKVLLVSIEMRHAPFFGWIKDLSAPDPMNIFTLFGFLPWDHPAFMQVGILPMLVALTMYVQQMLSPQSGDPSHAQVMKVMPFVFLFITGSFPAGLALYWLVSNLLSILQQALIARRFKQKQRSDTATSGDA